MRFACTILVTWALLLSFIEAPFAHVHDFGFGDDHHATEQAHTHLRHLDAHGDGPAFDQIDPADDARAINWFQTVQHASFVLFLAPAASELSQPVPISEFVRATPAICGHDPPLLTNLPTRAPPAIPA